MGGTTSGMPTDLLTFGLMQFHLIGIVIYAGTYIIHNIVALILGNWNIGVLIIPIIGLGFIGLSYKKFK